MLGIEAYEPQWFHDARTLAAAHRARFSRIIGRRLDDSWLMWDLRAGRWFADGPVVLAFGDVKVEVTHRKFDECAITWGQVDLTAPLDVPGLDLGWRAGAHPALRAVRGLRLREANVIERFMPSPWRPRILYAVEFRFDGVRLEIHNALDENGLSDAAEIGFPVGFWARVPVA